MTQEWVSKSYTFAKFHFPDKAYSHLIENNHLIFHINDYKTPLSSLPSHFDKLISIGLNISIKIAVFSQNYTATAAKFDEWLVK